MNLTWHQWTAIIRVGDIGRPVIPSEIAELPRADRPTIGLASAHSTLRSLANKGYVEIIAIKPRQFFLTYQGKLAYEYARKSRILESDGQAIFKLAS